MVGQGLSQGLLHLAGSTSVTRTLVNGLLEKDLESHHCFYGKVGFHNHLPHHILALYDLSAPPSVIQQMYNAEAKDLSPINLVDRKEQKVAPPDITITIKNWTEYVGDEKNYAPYYSFFKTEVERLGLSGALEEYVFSPKANGNETSMLRRAAGGALHPVIQLGYGLEFNLPYILASGLAEVAVTSPIPLGILDESQVFTNDGESLFSTIQAMYNSSILVPVMPYDPDALLSKRRQDALTNERTAEIKRLVSDWHVNSDTFDLNVQEAITLATLLLVGTSKPGRKPRLDFFIMHFLTSSLFLPTLARALKPESTARLLRAYLATALMYTLTRGRPRIDCALAMGYSATPHPPDARRGIDSNPWPAILDEVIHAPDSHTVKTIRTLYYAAQKWGEIPPGGLHGTLDKDGKEVLPGSARLDGTIFVRAAGVVMNTLGWITYGQKEGKWDRSALGWDAAWDGPDP